MCEYLLADNATGSKGFLKQFNFKPYTECYFCVQGYVCPGILVTLSEGADVRVVQEAWCAHALATPTGYRIYRLGLSGGCSVTPFPQVPTSAILAREKTNNRHFPPNISRIFLG
jgi:hypothetical protein